MSDTASGPAAVGGATGQGTARLLEDKLQVPATSLPLLPRVRLTEQIERAVQCRVTIVSGPAGAGKTVACASWASVTPASDRVAWVTLDAADGDPARFWAYVGASLLRAGLVPAEASAPLTAVTRAPGPGPGGAAGDVPGGSRCISPEAAALCLVEVAQTLTEPVILVLDDVHELADGAVLPSLHLLVRHAPPALRLVLSGRSAPGLPLARLRLSGEVADVGPADLACSAEEADRYFSMLGLRLWPAERDELLRRTEGWMAGIRLAAMRAMDASPAAGIAGDEPAVTDYLLDEVLGRQSPQTRLFLLRTSVAERISGELADALTGMPGGARTLERLARENSFVRASGQDQGEYRYHPLLRDLLAAEVHREIPHELPVLLRRAARWQAARGRGVDAILSAAQAGDWDYAAHVLAEAGAAMLLDRGPAELETALAILPADRSADDSAVAAAFAAARLWAGDADGAAHHLAAAQHALGRCSQADRRVVEPWLTALVVLTAAGQSGADPGLLARAKTNAEQAQGIAGTLAEHRSLGLLWYALGTARLARFEVTEGLNALEHSERQLAAGDLGGLLARARAWQALAEAWYGNLARAERLAHDSALRPALLARARVHLGRDELPAADRMLDMADDTDISGRDGLPGEPDLGAETAVVRARVRLADGDVNGARGRAVRLRGAGAPASPQLTRVLDLLDADIALCAGDLDRGRAAVAAADACPDSPLPAVQLARGRVQLGDRDFAGALQTVAPCLAGGTEGVMLGHQIASRLVAAVASRRMGRGEAAADLLEQALVLAEPDGACREFLDAGQPVRSGLIVLVPPASARADFARRVLSRFDARPAGGGPPAGDGPALTDSELAVLRFLPAQLTNQEIAEALYLSVNTVKTHLRSVYRKLGTGSRRDAVARGRRLQLL